MVMAKERIKANVSAFNRDVSQDGSYAYTQERLSSVLANRRITEAFEALYPMAGKRLLDLGCGDGTYSLDLVNLGAALVLGVDPSEAAVPLPQPLRRAMTRPLAWLGLLNKNITIPVGNMLAIGIKSV